MATLQFTVEHLLPVGTGPDAAVRVEVEEDLLVPKAL